MSTSRSSRSTPSTQSSSDSPNRAEDIRRRRVTRTSQRVSAVSNRVTNPVIVRGSAFGAPIHRQVGAKPRRQFYVAIDNAAGSELRLPAMPILHPGWRLLSALIVILAATALFSVLNSPFFQVTTVDVHGLQRLNATDLQAVLRLENLSIVAIQPAQIRDNLAAAFPELTGLQVTVSLPNVVTVTATERQPVLAWQQDDTVRWIDAEGYVFPARGDPSLLAAPIVTIYTADEIPLAPLTPDEAAQLHGLLPAATLPNVSAAAVSSLPTGLETIPGTAILGADAFINRTADLTLLNASLLLAQKLPPGVSVVYDQVNGIGWSDPQGYQVFIGKDLNNVELKFALLQTIAASLSQQGIRPELISVEHLNAPFYRLSVEQ